MSKNQTNLIQQKRPLRWKEALCNEEVPWMRVEDFHGLDLPRPIVVVNGVFDILHSSHMRLIFEARKKAKTLICAMDSDAHVVAQKGKERPIQTWAERAVALGYMPIDYLVEFQSESDLQNLITQVKADLRVTGVDHIHDVDPSGVKRMFIRDGQMRTSVVIERILRRYK
jgi:cytidyltransferase-like protein